MRDPSQILRQKEIDIERVRRQIEALHFAIPLLAEEEDWIEHGMVPPQAEREKPGIVSSPRAHDPRAHV